MESNRIQKTEQIQTRLTLAQADRLKEVAKANGLSRSEAIRSVIYEFISHPEKFPIANLVKLEEVKR